MMRKSWRMGCPLSSIRSLSRRVKKTIFRSGDLKKLGELEKKILNSFSFGANSFLLPPQHATEILSCLVDPGDIAGLIDNVRMGDAAWACEATCFPNNPMPDLQEGLGELEIKVESLRFIVCAGRDLLEGSSFNIENWILRKVSDGAI